MKRLLPTLTLFLAFATTAHSLAGTPAVSGHEKPVPCGGYAKVFAVVTPGDSITWEVRPIPEQSDQFVTDDQPASDGKVKTRTATLTFAVKSGVDYEIRCQVINWDARRLDVGNYLQKTVPNCCGPPTPTPPTPPNPPTPPTPEPPKPPEPQPSTDPIGLNGFAALIIFDPANTTRPPAELSVIYGAAVRDYLDKKCVADPTRSDWKAYRIWPENADVSRANKVWADAFGRKGGKDWLLIGTGKGGYSGPLPKTEAEALALLKKYGGE